MKLSPSILARTVWFLDYDGSVCPHQEVWEERIYDPEEIDSILLKMKERGARIFWNTGRRPESLGSVRQSFLQFPGYFIHGSCFWDGEHHWIGPLVPDSYREAAQSVAKKNPNLKLELKPTSLRFTPAPGKAIYEVHKALEELKSQTPPDWLWITGPRGAELLAKGFDKAVAFRREMERHPDLIPVAVGDDVLDRPAIEATLRAGGYAILVGEGCGWVTEIPHQPHQVHVFEDPRRVLDLMSELSAAREQG